MFKIVALIATAVATTATIAFPAQAETVMPTVKVRYSDLSLGSQAGADELKARIHRAAKRVCQSYGTRGVDEVAREMKCTQVTEARAMPQVELALANAGVEVAENSRITVAAH